MLKKNIAILLVVFALAMFCYYLLMQKNPEANPPAIPAYIEQATSGLWQTFQPANARFTVSFPKRPQQASTKQNSIAYTVYTAVGSDNTLFTVSMAEYPKTADLSDSSAIVRNILQKIVAGPPENTLIGETPLTVQGYAALDFNLQNIQHATQGRIILAENTLFVLTATNSQRNNLDKNFHTFVDSFKITVS